MRILEFFVLFVQVVDPIAYVFPVNTRVNICQSMSICSRLPTYVIICSYFACPQHMDKPSFPQHSMSCRLSVGAGFSLIRDFLIHICGFIIRDKKRSEGNT